MGIQLIMTTVIASTVTGCSWAHPGANPYRGDPVAALADFGLDDETRRRLAVLMRAHQPTDVAAITRDTITGNDGAAYGHLREMHSGHGQVCHGEVDRAAWRTTRRERGLVYCAGDACVIVPTICNNISLVTRKPDEPVAGGAPGDDEPIDISPAAGPPGAAPMTVPTDTGDGVASVPPGSLDSPAPVEIAGLETTDSPDTPVPGGGSSPVGDAPPYLGPIGGGGFGDGGCCVVGNPPGAPILPSSPVPEIPADRMWMAGAVALLARVGWKRRGA